MNATRPPFTLTASVTVELELEAVRARICKLGEGRSLEELADLARLHDAVRKCIAEVHRINPEPPDTAAEHDEVDPTLAADWWKEKE